jgi:hypothetical protein
VFSDRHVAVNYVFFTVSSYGVAVWPERWHVAG